MTDMILGPGGEASGHWYKPDPQGDRSVYEIRGTNGAMRPPTLRDARKLGLYPGVTSVLEIAARPALETWKRNRAIQWALERGSSYEWTPETLWQTVSKIDSDCAEATRNAADRGTSIHAAIEASYRNEPFEPEFAACVTAVHRALEDVFGEHDRSAWKAEEAHTSTLGFGGRVDLWSPTLKAVADIKSKDFTSPLDAPSMYPEQARQLAAYASMVLPEVSPIICVNVLVSRQIPELVVVHRWTADQISQAWDEFQLLWKLWKLTKGYDPIAQPC